MERSLRAGSAVFAAGIGAMGVLMLARLDVPPVLVPLPESLPGRVLLAGLSGAWLIGSALTILIDRRPRGAPSFACRRAFLSTGVPSSCRAHRP